MNNSFDAYWKEKGVEFVVVDRNHRPELMVSVFQHLCTSFFPDEPVGRSLGTKAEEDWLTKTIYKKALKDGANIVALDKEGRVLGARVGDIVRKTRGKWLESKLVKAFANPLSFLIPKDLHIMLKLVERAEYNTYKVFGELGCEAIYETKALSSARWHGIKGLGTELVKRSEALAKERGCSHTFVLATGKYSAAVFDKLGHTLVKSVAYADFVDSRGELLLKDTREHTHTRVYLKQL